MHSREKIRNVAIVAHIDHGKTTLLDTMLAQAEVFREGEAVPERAMDSYELERERGITIFAKQTSIFFDDYKINLIDTPGHADFSGEVERILGMVSSVLLLIDAKEGPMPQTRFVLSEALKMGLCPIVVLNKIDRPHADPDRALNLTFDLFVELGATDEQLDFAYCYASGLSGFAKRRVDEESTTLKPLFELIVEKVPAPTGVADLPFLMQVATLAYDDYLGRQATGRILEGGIKKGDDIIRVKKDGEESRHKVIKVEGYLGLKRVELEEAGVGDIATISGVPDALIGETLCSPEKITQLPPIDLSEPTLSIEISVNDGPFVGRDGKHVTMNKIRDRLERERKANITLKFEELEDAMRVSGRGELHIAVLLEAMRREGYEFLISKPQVILKDGEEPIESVHVEAPEEFSGSVIEELSRRKGEMQSLETDEHGVTRMQFLVPTRGLIGYRSEFLTVTKGLGILTSIFDHFAPHKGEIPSRLNGSLISMNQGPVTGYACFTLQDRGTLFVKPGDEVYEGMVIGAHSRDNDLVVNITREKQLTNVRASGSDESIILTPPRIFNLEQAIEYIEDDERAEITPKHIRFRKKLLKEVDRKRAK